MVLHEMAKGLANKQIASVLNITQNTAKGYLKSILYKLHVADRTEAVTVAIQRGLIHLRSKGSNGKAGGEPAALNAIAKMPFRRVTAVCNVQEEPAACSAFVI